MEALRISIITVCLNAESTIQQTILSVLIQNYPNIEYIIKDGGSHDKTLEIAKKYSDRIRIVVEKDTGIYDAMNQGKLHATGDYLLFLGADDVLYDEGVISSVAKQAKNKDKVYYGNVMFLSNNQEYDGRFNKWKWGYRNICHQSIFYPKSIYTVYDYNEKYRLVADWVYNLTLLKDRVEFEFVNILITKYNNVTGISSNKNDNLFLKERLYLTAQAVGYLPVIYGLFVKVWKKITLQKFIL